LSIHRFFTKSVIIRRLRTLTGRKKGFQSTATVEGHIQSLSREARQRIGIVEERAWIAWFPLSADIKEGDYLVDEYNTTSVVREITKKDYGVNQHLEVIMEEANE